MTTLFRSLVRPLFALALLATLAISGLNTVWAESIGYVDFARITNSYEQLQSFSNDSKIKEAELNKMRADYIKQVEDSRRVNAGNPITTQNLEKQLQEKLRLKMEEYSQWTEEKAKALDAKMTTIIKTVAQRQGISVVLDKQVVISGGVEMTNEVIKTLNQTP